MSRSFLVGLVAVLACGGSYQPTTAPGPAVERNVVTGTCREYDYNARTLELITGVSFALRLMEFRVHGDTEITAGGRRAPLAELQANTVLRIEYRVTPQGNLADRIMVIMDARGLRGAGR